MKAVPLYLSCISGLLFILPILLAAGWPVSRVQYRYLGAACAVFCTSTFFLILPFALPVLKVGHANWTGKILSIVAVYTIILLRPRSDPARKFMTFTQRKGSLRRSLAIVLLLVLFSVLVTVLGSDDGRLPINPEKLAFEATLPGIDEEAVFRAAFLGYSLAAVSRRKTGNFEGLVGPVFANMVLFGLIHALHVDAAFHMHFDIATFAITGSVGAGLAILTLNSGSIFLPVIAHNLANCVGMLV
ncbi:MAG: CPBP family glutamic-type intramembrane protease [Janthinobacterium lividum]